MTFLTAWAVDGDGVVPASMARRETYNSSNGNGGITDADDLVVTPLPTPGTGVRIASGAATILNTYPGGAGQAYAVGNDAPLTVSVPATGSGSGATRYVIVRIDDPEFGGQTPSNPQTATYTRAALVSSISGLNYPFIPLAKITQPASTSTITGGMIEDLREIANPGVWQETRTYFYGEGESETLTRTDTYGEVFPNVGFNRVKIPAKATEMTIKVTWAGVVYPSGNTYGKYWLEFGNNVGSPGPSSREFTTRRLQFSSVGQANGYRGSWMLMDTVPVDKSMRGQIRGFSPMGYIVGGGGDKPVMDDKAGVMIELFFRQVPIQEE